MRENTATNRKENENNKIAWCFCVADDDDVVVAVDDIVDDSNVYNEEQYSERLTFL